MRIIGITGPAGCGKSTIAALLVHGRGGVVVPFAQPLKRLCKAYNWDGEKDEKGRRLLQEVGQAFRDYDELTWVNAWKAQVERHRAEGCALLVADDVRYDNEARIIRELGGSVVRLEGREDYTLEHSSEMPIRPELVDDWILNVEGEQVSTAEAIYEFRELRAP